MKWVKGKGTEDGWVWSRYQGCKGEEEGVGSLR